jgi:hypothetical protein
MLRRRTPCHARVDQNAERKETKAVPKQSVIRGWSLPVTWIEKTSYR